MDPPDFPLSSQDAVPECSHAITFSNLVSDIAQPAVNAGGVAATLARVAFPTRTREQAQTNGDMLVAGPSLAAITELRTEIVPRTTGAGATSPRWWRWTQV